MPPGTIILLNGTTSAGKTSIARAVQAIADEPYLHLGADALGSICPPGWAGGTHAEEGFAWVPVPDARPPMTELRPGLYGDSLVSALHHMVATLARLGHNVVVDHILQEPRWLAECVALWERLPVLFVSVRCPLAVAETRERERGDRARGVARWQFERVHAHACYDLEVDPEHEPWGVRPGDPAQVGGRPAAERLPPPGHRRPRRGTALHTVPALHRGEPGGHAPHAGRRSNGSGGGTGRR